MLTRNLLLVSLLVAAVAGRAATHIDDEVSGLLLTVTSGEKTDVSLAPNVWLHVPAGTPATPFVPAGKFTARWEGTVNAELRSDFEFHGEFTGHLKLTIGDTVALDADGKGDERVSGTSVRLGKGANRLVAEYVAPDAGDAFVRLFWSNRETPYNPIPLIELKPAESDALAQSQLVRKGRDLFAEARCIQCHTAPGGMPELAMDAPSFNAIGARRNFGWLARWIENPHALRPGTPMPQLFHGPEAKASATAVAAYLASLTGDVKFTAAGGAVENGQALFERLHCVACHVPPGGGDARPHQISQQQVNAKFAPGALAAFLQRPEEHFAWIRMPNFKLTAPEAADLAAYLQSVAEKAEPETAPADAAILEQGRKLVATSGCLNCHALEGGKSELAARPLAGLATWTAGCLADQPAEASQAPRYAFTDEQRSALRAFAATDRASLTRHTPADFLRRQSRHLNCRECHGQFEGFPHFELMFGKLKPEWAAKFIAGGDVPKPRPWLESRMPAFPAYAQSLAAGLATIHGFPPKTPADPKPADHDELVKAGHQLVGSQGGLQCISCHPVNELGATQVFEAPGINLGYSFDRLNRSFFDRWLRAPTSLDMESKMPVYFDEEGRSPLPDILEGNGPRTIQAVWEYMRLGKDMPKPE